MLLEAALQCGALQAPHVGRDTLIEPEQGALATTLRTEPGVSWCTSWPDGRLHTCAAGLDQDQVTRGAGATNICHSFGDARRAVVVQPEVNRVVDLRGSRSGCRAPRRRTGARCGWPGCAGTRRSASPGRAPLHPDEAHGLVQGSAGDTRIVAPKHPIAVAGGEMPGAGYAVQRPGEGGRLVALQRAQPGCMQLVGVEASELLGECIVGGAMIGLLRARPSLLVPEPGNLSAQVLDNAFQQLQARVRIHACIRM